MKCGGICLRVKNEGWGGQGVGGWYHKFVYECNRIPLVTEGCMKNFITLVQPPLLFFSQKNVTHPLVEGGGGGPKQIQIINQISRHFRQFWSLFHFHFFLITKPQPPLLVGSRFFWGCNLILLVTDGRMQNFKTLAQSLLGEFG